MFSQYFLSELDPNLLSQPGVLATVSFNDGPCRAARLGDIATGLRSLGGDRVEVICYGDSPAERGFNDRCQWNVIDDLACVATWIDDQHCSDIEYHTYVAYMGLFNWMRERGFQWPLRVWNFIPNINSGEGDREEYKKFCCGRHRAFTELGLSERDYPAASALGHFGQGAVIYALASSRPGQHVENPMQDPAYEYPRIYGPRSPSFARASIFATEQQKHILISGTASIRGHRSLGEGDILQQLAITKENFTGLQRSVAPDADQFSPVRVYLRHADDLDIVQAWLEQNFAQAQTIVLHAEICRTSLSVEIETVAQSRV